MEWGPDRRRTDFQSIELQSMNFHVYNVLCTFTNLGSRLLQLPTEDWPENTSTLMHFSEIRKIDNKNVVL